MWLADNWKDYEVLDTSNGEKLERWGNYLLVRPDPQVVWNTPHTNPGWKKKNGHYHRSSKGGGEWEFFSLPQQWSIHYGKLTFQLKPFSFKHTGLFPEQAANWDWFSNLIQNANRPIKVLNLFAYTGGATLAAAAAGASVTHVDASKGMLPGQKKMQHLVDCLMHRFAGLLMIVRNLLNEKSDAAITMMQSSWIPPSYGRGPKGEIWKIEDAIHPLVSLCSQLLSDKPLFFLINSYTTGFAASVLTYLLGLEVVSKFGGHVVSDEIGLPVTQSGLVLPCGSSGRWTSI